MKKYLILVLGVVFLMTGCWEVGSNNGSTNNIKYEEAKSYSKQKNFCEYCGKEFDNIRDMAINSCKKHPDGIYEGSHKLYEGSIKSKYECKYCGKKEKTIYDLVSSKCKHSPYGGWHIPRL